MSTQNETSNNQNSTQTIIADVQKSLGVPEERHYTKKEPLLKITIGSITSNLALAEKYDEKTQSYRRCIDDALRDSIVEVCSEDPRGMFVRFSNDLLQESFPFADQLGIIIDETDSETVILEKVCILHFMSSIGLGRYTPELVLDQYRNFCKDHGIKPKSLMSWSDCLKEIASEMSEDIPPVLSDSGEVGTSDEEVHA